jgi:hypothetical protein
MFLRVCYFTSSDAYFSMSPIVQSIVPIAYSFQR